MRPVMKRWGAALAGVVCGWGACFLAYVSMANPGPHDVAVWALWTGAFCLFAWFVVGLPLALAGPDLSSPGRIAAATLLCGAAGVLLIVLFFRTPAAVFSVFGALAFLAAAVAMLVYATLSNAVGR